MKVPCTGLVPEENKALLHERPKLLPWLLEAAEAEAPAASADNRAAHIVCGGDLYADAGYGIPKNGIPLWQYEE